MKRKVLLKGAAGLDLLHRISSIDIPRLPEGRSRTGLLLNPAGRIESVFDITRTGADSAEISFEDGFLDRLEHYTFSERYELTPLPPEEQTEESVRERILRLEPREGFEFLPDGQTNPLEVNLASAIDANKGCYPGQEVIEKIQALGSPARRLCLLRRISGGPPPALPAPLASENGDGAGLLTSQEEGELALGIVKRTHLREGVELRSGDAVWRVERVSA